MRTERMNMKPTATRQPAAVPLGDSWRLGGSWRRNGVRLRRGAIPILVAAADLAATLVPGLAIVAATGAIAGPPSGTPGSLSFCLVAAILFVSNNLLRGDYDLTDFLAFAGHSRRIVLSWNTSFLMALLIAAATNGLIAPHNHMALLLSYGGSLCAALAMRAVLVARIKNRAVAGRVAAVRILLVGEETEIRAFTARFSPWLYGVDVVGSFALRGPETLREDLALARAAARMLRPDDIYVLAPWTSADLIEACVEALVKIPASIHLGPPPVLNRYSAAAVSRVGRIHSLNLVRRPLTRTEQGLKRALDLALTLPAVIVLAPVFLCVAIAIKLDSPGPVLFLQRRYGFNQETFRIVKFRSMRVAEEGSNVRQATRADPRVTRVGKFIRRYNIDELPQLLNVLRGDMSLVGPRPHALIHNQQYEQSIADYARRHNVKPGITGWAQIHGLRGEVSGPELMERRLQHDLYYIDNWSLGLDLRILAMTLFSTKAFTNAY